MELPAGVSTSTYTYAGTGYANPHAVTSIGNGLSTTTYAYDNDGNLTSAGNGTATTTYEAIGLKGAMGTVESASRLGLVILDACRNNPFQAKMQRSTRTRSVFPRA